MSQPIRVAVGIIPKNDKILLCQRKPTAQYPLKWEFPGGKAFDVETIEETLARELNEELGIAIRAIHPVHQATTQYDDGGKFSVTYFVIDDYAGHITNYVFHNIVWVAIADLPKYDILEGNREVVRQIVEGTLPHAHNRN